MSKQFSLLIHLSSAAPQVEDLWSSFFALSLSERKETRLSSSAPVSAVEKGNLCLLFVSLLTPTQQHKCLHRRTPQTGRVKWDAQPRQALGPPAAPTG